jgi:hypothetical protein
MFLKMNSQSSDFCLCHLNRLSRPGASNWNNNFKNILFISVQRNSFISTHLHLYIHYGINVSIHPSSSCVYIFNVFWLVVLTLNSIISYKQSSSLEHFNVFWYALLLFIKTRLQWLNQSTLKLNSLIAAIFDVIFCSMCHK